MEKKFNLTTANIPKELLAMIKLLNSDNTQKVLSSSPKLFSEIDWELFMKQVRHHRVYPSLYNKLKGNTEYLMPSHVLEQLAHEYRRNTFHMLHLSGEMERLNRLFFNKNIRSLYLKGPVLAHELYEDVSHRTSSDLDILIPMRELDEAENILLAEGYIKDDYIESVLNDWKWRHHHFSYYHPQKKVKVEVHWRLSPGPGKEPHFDELWDRRKLSQLTSSPVYLLGREDLFIFLASHGARHGWSRLRWLIDMKQLMDQPLDWIKVKTLLRKFHLTPVGEQSIILASELFDVEVPKPFNYLNSQSHSHKLAQSAIFYLENMVNLHTDPVPDFVAKYHKRYLFSIKSLQQKFLFLISLLYPYPEDVVTLRLPKSVHYLYFPLRPILCLWRKMKPAITTGRT